MYCAEIKIVYEIITALGHMNLAEGFGFFSPLKKKTLEQILSTSELAVNIFWYAFFFLPAIRGSADQYIKLS